MLLTMDQKAELSRIDEYVNGHEMDSNIAELDTFLDKVNEINMIIKNMRSTDPTISTEAMDRANTILATQSNLNCSEEGKTYTKYNRTVLNRSILEKTSSASPSQATMSTEEFMATVEKDAKDRASRQKLRKS